MIPGMLFAFWRFWEIVTLIPIIGMLSWFVNGFTKNNQLTPTFILVLFIVSTLAGAWAVGTLFMYHRARTSGGFIAFIDLCFVGALIAGVYELRDITHANCAHFGDSRSSIYLNLGPFGEVGANLNDPLALHVDKSCAMLKASFALAIMNIIFFFITFVSALFIRSISIKAVLTFQNSSSPSGSATTTGSNTTGPVVRKSSTSPAVAVPTTRAAQGGRTKATAAAIATLSSKPAKTEGYMEWFVIYTLRGILIGRLQTHCGCISGMAF
jgi:hypothetical protein